MILNVASLTCHKRTHSASRQTVMGDDIYDESLPYKFNGLIPKLNGLSMIKTGSDSDLKETTGYKNGYVHHNEVKSSRSGSQIMFVNSAMYVEKVDPSPVDQSKPLPQGFSRGDGKHKKNYKSNEVACINNEKLLTSKILAHKLNKHVNGIIVNGAGDRQLSPIRCPEISESNKILSDCNPNNDEDLIENLPTTRDFETSSSESFRSVSVEDNSSSASYSDAGNKNNTKHVKNPSLPSLQQETHSAVSEDIKDPIKTLPRLFYRSYSNIDKITASPLSGKTTNIDQNLSSSSTAVAVPRRYSTRLSDPSSISTFPEKCIRQKILSALAEKGDFHYVTVECKSLLPHNWENLIALEDLAWFRWYTSKLQQERRKKEAERNVEATKKEDKLRQKDQKLRKQKIESDKICEWKEKKEKESAEKKKLFAKKLELERQKKEEEQRKIQMLAQKARAEWSKKKENELKEQKLKEEQKKQQLEEEKRLRAARNKEAFEIWNEKAKQKAKPMSLAIKDHKGRSDPALAQLNWNPIPWRDIVDERESTVPKDPGKKNKSSIKPCST